MRDRSLPVMLFAAGFGTRMMPLTQDRPKPLVEVAGRTLLDRTLDYVRAHGAGPIVVNTHYKADMIANHLAGQDIRLSDEQPDILDTGGGLKAALPLLGQGAVFTSNTDAIWLGVNPFDLLLQAWDPDRMGALLLCTPIDRTSCHPGSGDFAQGSSGRLSRGGTLVYGGIQIIDASVVDQEKDTVFSLNRVWNRLESEGRLFGHVYPGHWLDIGTPEGVAVAEQMMEQHDVS